MFQVYVLKRLLLFPVVWVGVAILVFVLIRIVPGSAIDVMLGEAGIAHPQYGAGKLIRDELAKDLGIDKPLHIQFVHWFWGAARGDLGVSFFSGKPVSDEIVRRIPVSLELAFLSLAVGVPLGILFGVISAIRQDTFLEYFVRISSLAGISVPNFAIGTLLLLGFSVWFRWIPPIGYISPFEDLGANLMQFSLPAITLGIGLSASITRMTRSSVLEVMRQDYIRTAWAKGLRESLVIYRHTLKNALIPVVTIIGLQMGNLLAGSTISETIFSLPGIGRLTVEAIVHRDYPQLQGNVMFIATVVLASNLLVDLLYAWLDPRIKYS